MTYASEGLREIFRFGEANVAGQRAANADAGMSAISSLAIYVRHWLSRLTQFGSLDQAFTVAVSLRSLSPANWDAFLSGTPILVPMPTELFVAHDYVRLKGISASLLEASDAPLCMALRVRPPKDAMIGRTGDDAQTIEWSSISQKAVPSVSIGRVFPMNATQAPELAGSVSIANVSPISAQQDEGPSPWRISLERMVIGTASDISDVLITLHCAGRPALRGAYV